MTTIHHDPLQNALDDINRDLNKILSTRHLSRTDIVKIAFKRGYTEGLRAAKEQPDHNEEDDSST